MTKRNLFIPLSTDDPGSFCDPPGGSDGSTRGYYLNG
jgi:hypothetical protein